MLFSQKREPIPNKAKQMNVETQPSSPHYQQANAKANTDILDLQLFEKTDLDYIPGLDYDLGPVVLPSMKFKRKFFLKKKKFSFPKIFQSRTRQVSSFGSSSCSRSQSTS